MENKERLIKELENKIEQSEAAVNILYERIGEDLFAAEPEKKEASLAASILSEIETIDKEVNAERARIDNILAAVERADEIEALRKSLTVKIKSIEKDNISNYETIGRASYQAYKDGELPSEKYRDTFAEIIRIMIKIENSETERERLDDSSIELKFFDKVKSGARKIYLKNAVSGYYSQLQRQYKKAGEVICHSELVMNLEAESLDNAMKPFRENMQGIEKLEQEDQELNSETEKLQGSLEGLGVQANPVKTISEIEKKINEMYKQRKEKQREAGELVYLNQKDSLAKIASVKLIFKDIKKEMDLIFSWQDEIKSYEAEIEIERQNKEILALNKKISGYEEKITNYSQEADQLKEKIQLAEKNIKKLEDAAKNGEDDNA